MFVVDNKRIVTMRKHLGKASELIKDDAYLPMFRNRQKKYNKSSTNQLKWQKLNATLNDISRQFGR